MSEKKTANRKTILHATPPQEQNDAADSSADIAIIGMACRFPGADNYSQFWNNLQNGVDSVSEIPKERWDVAKYYSVQFNAVNKSISKWCGLIADIDCFDNDFFHISPREAAVMDPQQRLMLETAWNCVEESGLSIQELQAIRTDVIIGVMASDYQQMLAASSHATDSYAALGNYSCILANRISHIFGFNGESISLDAACASSLVAIHHAKKNLISDHSVYALAGGVNLNLAPWKYISFSKAGMLSRHGRCATFDRDADGYVPGDGVGAVLLTKLATAKKRGHHIHGIIRGSAVSHTGTSRGITVPTIIAQQNVIASALAESGLGADAISFVEAHGTGTSLGDPIEVEALSRIFKAQTAKKQYCYLGAVKTNIGHLESAAGIAGLIKILLMFKHRKIPGNLHCRLPNPIINFPDTPFKLPLELLDWETNGDYVAAISSFGFGGVNAHVVLSAYQNDDITQLAEVENAHPPGLLENSDLIIISADSSEQLTATRKALACFLEENIASKLRDVAATLWRRKLCQYRLIVDVDSTKALLEWLHDENLKPMTAQLLRLHLHIEASQCLSDTIALLNQNNLRIYSISSSNRCFLQAISISGLYQPDNQDLPHYRAPTLTTYDPVENNWLFSAICSCEYVQQVVAALHVECQTLQLYTEKAKLLYQHQYTFKKYLQAWNDYEPVLDYLNNTDIAYALDEKSENKCLVLFLAIVSSLERLNKKWNLQSQFNHLNAACREVVYWLVDHLITPQNLIGLIRKNSPVAMDDIVFKMNKAIVCFEKHELQRYPLLLAFNQEKFNKDKNWGEQAQNTPINLDDITAKFSDLPETPTCIIQVGGKKPSTKTVVPLILMNEQTVINRVLQELFSHGAILEPQALYPRGCYQDLALPVYPFAKERHWLPEQSLQDPLQSPKNDLKWLHPLVHTNSSDLSEQRFTTTFSGDEFFLKDHVVNTQHMLPGVAYLEMAQAAVKLAVPGISSDTNIRLENVVWARPIVVGEQTKEVHIALVPQNNGSIAYKIYTLPEQIQTDITLHSQGSAVMTSLAKTTLLELFALQGQCQLAELTQNQCYQLFQSMGINYGNSHQGIQQLHIGTNQALAKICLPGVIDATLPQFTLHPSLLDAALQASIVLTIKANASHPEATFSQLIGDADSSANRQPILPFSVGMVEILGSCMVNMWAWVRFCDGSTPTDKVLKFVIDLCDETGKTCVRLTELSLRIMEQQPAAVSLISEKELDKNDPLIGKVMMMPVWNPLPPARVRNQEAHDTNKPVLIIGATTSQTTAIKERYKHAKAIKMHARATVSAIVTQLKAQEPLAHIVWVAKQTPKPARIDDSIIAGQQHGVLQVFRLIKALLALGYETKSLTLSFITTNAHRVIPNELVDATHSSVHGLVGSLAKEYQCWNIRLFDMEAVAASSLTEMFTIITDNDGNTLAYRDKTWYQQQLIPISERITQKPGYRSKGVYVIIGGAGGIGAVLSRFLIEHYQAQIIWIDLRDKTAHIQAKIDELAKFGPEPHYIVADATKKADLEAASLAIKQRFGEVNGVVHAAIILKDQSLVRMEESTFLAGLSAKVDISVRLAQVWAQEALDFILFFSSMISFSRPAGQSNYASGCVFKDAFAHQLENAGNCAVKVMNWGYWGSVGIVSSAKYQEIMRREGLGSIEPDEGMAALGKLMAWSIPQMVFLKTLKPMVLKAMNHNAWITVCPDGEPPHIQQLQNTIGKYDLAPEKRQAGGGLLAHNLQEHLCRLLYGQLQTMGLFSEKQILLSQCKQKIGWIDLYDRWFATTLAMLTQANYLQCNDLTYTVINHAPIDLDAEWHQWHQQKTTWLNSSQKSQVILLEAMLVNLPNILTGKVASTAIMFPHSSMELVQGVYKGNVISDYFNDIMADAVATYVNYRLQQDSSARLRILEIGAGTGGTTAAILEKLNAYQQNLEEYCYTDLSQAFLLHAKAQFGVKNPFLTTAIFDVEKPLSGQNINLGHYDIVIAANVLHATKNIRNTLQNAKAALGKQGVLLLNELSTQSLFTHLTFGLLAGWWLFEDQHLRIPGSPGLYPKMWEQVLTGEGFYATFFPANSAHDLGQQIIVTASDGIIRQKYTNEVSEPPSKMAEKLPSLPLKPREGKPTVAEKPGSIDDDSLRERSIAFIKNLVAETLKTPSHKIDASVPLEHYGIDSILVVELTQVLNTVLESVSSTLFFEYQNIDALVDHFIATQKPALMRLVGVSKPQPLTNASGVNENSQVSANTATTSSRFLPFTSDKTSPEPENSGIRDVAIIGLAGRYPQADDVAEFWNNLQAGINCITEIPQQRWDWRKYFDREKGKSGKSYTKWGGFINDIDAFDPLFFKISPHDALQMDPQERLFLEIAYKSIEDAGYTPTNLSQTRRIGVYVGVMNGTYTRQSRYWSVANRLSYCFDFQGPSMAVDSACSSSLTALHLALESLYSGMSECAIVGGVNVIVHPDHYLGLSEMTMLSASAQCRAFGDQADGFVDGEGVGAVVLKPLDKAVADRDHIYGVIKGSMLNAGGKTNGYTVPNPHAQAQLVVEALRRSKIAARTISYIEAHGTGTILGDPIEIAGLTRAFGQTAQDTQFCAIGSVKSNIGHCESAAGIAGLTKVLLQLKARQIAPSLHANPLNPNIDFTATPFVVSQQLTDWQRPVIDGKTYPRRAGISGFGAGGANAHVIIEEYIPKEPMQLDDEPSNVTEPSVVVVLSARNHERLREYVHNLLTFIQPKTATNHHNADQSTLSQLLLDKLAQLLAVVMEVDGCDIDREQSFAEYGCDRIQLTELLQSIETTLDLHLESATFWQQASLLGVRDCLLQDKTNQVPIETHLLPGTHAPIEVINQPVSTISLANLAYTLQTGREAMAERFGVVVGSMQELQAVLQDFVDGRDHKTEIYHGNSGVQQTPFSAFAADEEMQNAVKAWISKKKYAKLLGLWVHGLTIDWNQLYGNNKPFLISLPTYPFAKERYWQEHFDSPTNATEPSIVKLHPLVEQNTSTLQVQQFTTILRGHEFYLADHLVGDTHVLAGAAYIEMAHAAGKLSGLTDISRITSIVWLHPMIFADQPYQLDICLSPQGQMIDFEIVHPEVGKNRVVHAQGKIATAPIASTQEQHLDLGTIQKRCHEQIDGAECYRLLQNKGLKYGPGLQVIRTLYRNKQEVLAHLVLPSLLQADFADYGLHPALLDSAFQAVIGFWAQLETQSTTIDIPFSIGQIEISAALTPNCYAYLRKENSPHRQDPTTNGFAIDIVNENGQIALRVSHLMMRSFVPNAKAATPPEKQTLPLNYLQPTWVTAKTGLHAPAKPANECWLVFDDQSAWQHTELLATNVIVVNKGDAFMRTGKHQFTIDVANAEHYRQLIKTLAAENMVPEKIVYLWAMAYRDMQPSLDASTLDLWLATTIFAIFSLTHALLECLPKSKIQLVFFYQLGFAPGAAINAAIKTLHLEHPTLRYKSVGLASDAGSGSDLSAMLLQETHAATLFDVDVGYFGQERKILDWIACEMTGSGSEVASFRRSGVYIITGGTGGLGFIVAKYLATSYQARLVLAGRSILDASKSAKVAELKSLGADAIYMQVDISKKEAVIQLVTATKSMFHCINGIIHSAGITQDALITNKTKQQFVDVLAPKIYGTVFLDDATRAEPLDLFVVFSSISAVIGNIGQMDYAYGNSFMDHFMATRRRLETNQHRHGRSVAINWPLWRDGGMLIGPQVEEMLWQTMGMVALNSTEGVQALLAALASVNMQVLVFKGDLNRLKLRLQPQSQPASARRKPSLEIQRPPAATNIAPISIENDLTEICSSLLQLATAEIETNMDLSEYGVDSIMMIAMMNQIEKHFGYTIEPNAIAEYRTISALSEHLLAEGVGQRIHTDDATATVQQVTNIQVTPTETPIAHERTRFITAEKATKSRVEKIEKIAVIALSCKFPKSNSLAAYWENLCQARDLITTVPPGRWNREHLDNHQELESTLAVGGFLDDIDSFAADYFNVNDEDAIVMDPQQRILLELALDLIYRGGYQPRDIAGKKIGVFIGGAENQYVRSNQHKIPPTHKHMILNTLQNMMAGRIADFFDLKGPATTIDTACSSALVALHQACCSIRNGECSAAIAGGIELLIDPFFHIGFKHAEILSPVGRCCVFDETANGLVLGEGAGLTLLKPYEQAIADGDDIMAIIRGSAVNNDGHTMGLTVPSLEGQADVIEQAISQSQVAPENIGYLEAHGTGTLLGDPIEIKAATRVYRRYTKARQFCAVGSVKSNMGHLLHAAGMASFIKVVLSLKNRFIPPTLHCRTPHPRFNFSTSPFYPEVQGNVWKTKNEARYAGLSSFGFGGTNAHMIVQSFARDGYVPKQSPRTAPSTRRSRYWLGNAVVPVDVSLQNEAFYRRLVTDLRSGLITRQDGLRLIKEYEGI